MSTLGGRPLVVDTKATQIRHRLAEAIINGEFRPGDRIVLDEIARELGVSKIPLREALSSLEGAGLVVTTPHAGPRVAPLPRRELRGVYHLREEVESLAMRLAIPRMDAARIATLRELNEQMRRGIGHADEAEMSALNSEFHLEIARATTFTSIADVVGELLTKVRRYRAVIADFASDWEHAIAEHDEILAALEAGDADSAIGAARRHVRARGETDAPADAENT
ncbi:GntR family transcriptional regulator [Paenarthrobacter sp. A20]|uniref:GntR family transcriptional regulator n=1 Tax=Paenarthrobacter sp. A20 TaxID=2817891 RepID=UPI0020A20693|nr:GntR family transcriptional regulator [Paenarthrobacter sp. A20]MCP1415742.1 DNA-binding GntR family transcriptional regulator [Paenarthrobacter sp. A20]